MFLYHFRYLWRGSIYLLRNCTRSTNNQ